MQNRIRIRRLGLVLVALFATCINLNVQINARTTSKFTNVLHHIDKIAGLSLIVSPIINSILDSKLDADPLNKEEDKRLRGMLDDLCGALQINASTIKLAKGENAVLSWASAYPALWGKSSIKLSNDFFKLPTDQQKAILGHELIHIKHHDNLTINFACLTLPLITIGLLQSCAAYVHTKLNSSLTRNILTTLGKSWIVGWAATFLATGISTTREEDEHGNISYKHVHYTAPGGFILRKLSHYLETRADVESARKTGTAASAIASFKTQDPESLAFESPYDAHPTTLERIEHLENVLNDQLRDSK